MRLSSCYTAIRTVVIYLYFRNSIYTVALFALLFTIFVTSPQFTAFNISSINTKKAFKKLYIFILRRFGLILIHLQSKK